MPVLPDPAARLGPGPLGQRRPRPDRLGSPTRSPPGSADSLHRHTRLTHTNVTGRPPAGRSRTYVGRRSCSRACTPQLRQKSTVVVVSTACSSSPFMLRHREQDEPVQPQHRRRRATLVVHLGPPSTRVQTPRIVRPQALPRLRQKLVSPPRHHAWLRRARLGDVGRRTSRAGWPHRWVKAGAGMSGTGGRWDRRICLVRPRVGCRGGCWMSSVPGTRRPRRCGHSGRGEAAGLERARPVAAGRVHG